MSDEEKSVEQPVEQSGPPHSEVECSMCGRDGGTFPECPLCHGNARVQKRHFTLTEERQGMNPNPGSRYGQDGGVGPKIVNLPGSYNPHGEG